MLNMQEGTRAGFLKEVITMFTHQDDWIMEIQPPCGNNIIIRTD